MFLFTVFFVCTFNEPYSFVGGKVWSVGNVVETMASESNGDCFSLNNVWKYVVCSRQVHHQVFVAGRYIHQVFVAGRYIQQVFEISLGNFPDQFP